MAGSEFRTKLAYLKYEDMLEKIESGDLDAYDIVFSKDRYVQYIIKPDLTPLEIKSRIKVYNSISEAVTDTNQSTDTYDGQIISILDGGSYRAYLVNKDAYGRFVVVPAYEQPSAIDYDSLANIPIKNINGTASNPIVLSELTNGIYLVKGYYCIISSDNLKTSIVGIIAIKEEKVVKIITTKTIKYYEIDDSGESYNEKKYVIDSELKQTLDELRDDIDDDVDEKIENLKLVLADEIKDYVDSKFEEVVEDIREIAQEVVDETFESQEIKSNEINALFI